MCWPMKLPSFESASTGPSTYTFALGSSRRPFDE